MNPRHDADLQVEFTLTGSVTDGGTAQILHDADWNAYNSFDNPTRVVPRQQPINGNGSKILLDLPRLSVATATLKIR